MKIVVTGGAGFIGSHIAEALAERGDEVTVVDNFSTGRKENLAHLGSKIEIAEGTITDTEFLRKIFKGKDAVVHQAALPSVPVSIERPQDTNNANIDGTLSVLVAAKDSGIDRVIYASSSSVYGDTPTLPKVETMQPSPLSPYAIQKFAGEMYARRFYALYGLKTIGLRYFNVFGPRQNPNSQYAAAIPKFITMIKDGQKPVINGDGEHTRDFTYVDNVVNANICALESKQGFGEVFNIASGGQISLNELIAKINEILGTSIQPEYGPEREGDIKHSFADISKAQETLGYEPKIPFDDGLKITIESFK
jgi:UDP-glucose 4-epimerase